MRTILSSFIVIPLCWVISAIAKKPLEIQSVYILIIILNCIFAELKFAKIKPFCKNQSLEYQTLTFLKEIQEMVMTANFMTVFLILLLPGGFLAVIALLGLNIYAYGITPGEISNRVKNFYEPVGDRETIFEEYTLPRWNKLNTELKEQILKTQYSKAPVAGRPTLLVKKRLWGTTLTIIIPGDPSTHWCPENEEIEPLRQKLTVFPKTLGKTKRFKNYNILQRGE